MPSSVIGFWYRQSPDSLVRLVGIWSLGGIRPGDPPLRTSGESRVTLDTRGKLLFVLISTVFFSNASDSPLTWIVTAVEWGVTYFILVRLGLLAITAGLTFALWLYGFPITPQLSAWYSGIGLAGVVLLLAFAAYAFHTSLGGRPMFQARILED